MNKRYRNQERLKITEDLRWALKMGDYWMGIVKTKLLLDRSEGGEELCMS